VGGPTAERDQGVRTAAAPGARKSTNKRLRATSHRSRRRRRRLGGPIFALADADAASRLRICSCGVRRHQSRHVRLVCQPPAARRNQRTSATAARRRRRRRGTPPDGVVGDDQRRSRRRRRDPGQFWISQRQRALRQRVSTAAGQERVQALGDIVVFEVSHARCQRIRNVEQTRYYYYYYYYYYRCQLLGVLMSRGVDVRRAPRTPILFDY
jgi:hypothetical protein